MVTSLSKTILEQAAPATGSKVFLTFMTDSHIGHLIKLARDPDLMDSMGWNTFFEEEEKEGFIESVSCFIFPYSQKSQPIVFGIRASSKSYQFQGQMRLSSYIT